MARESTTTPVGEAAATTRRSMRHFTPRPTKPGIGRPVRRGSAVGRTAARGERT